MDDVKVHEQPGLPDGYYCLRDVCRILGRPPHGVHGVRSAMKRHRIKPQRHGKYVMISEEQLNRLSKLEDERLIAPYASRAPDGWIDTHTAKDALSMSYLTLYRYIEKGSITAVFDGIGYRLEPSSVERLRLELNSQRPLPGWVPLLSFEDSVGGDVATAQKWIEEAGLEPPRWFRNPANGYRPQPYILSSVLSELERKYRGQFAPRGWVALSEVVASAGVSTTYRLMQWLQKRGVEIRLYWVSHTYGYYARRADVKPWLEMMSSPPDGWEAVVEFEAARGLTRAVVLNKLLRRFGRKDENVMRNYRNPRTGRVTVHAPTALLLEIAGESSDAER